MKIYLMRLFDITHVSTDVVLIYLHYQKLINSILM